MLVLEAKAAPVELYYDDGTGIGGGPAGFNFNGVKFSLPVGAISAKILSVRFWWNAYPTSATVHITGPDHQTELTTPIVVAITAFGWQEVDVSSRNIIVSGDFYVILEKTGAGNTVFDAVGVGRSYYGTSLATLTNPFSYDYLIRATVDPAYARPVGGVVVPTDKLEIMTPYLALAGLVAIVSTVVVAKRRRA